MAYIYAADIYCDDCGNAIKRDIAMDILHGISSNPIEEFVDREGHEDMTYDAAVDDIIDQLDRTDEHDYDSDEYPKGCYGDGESDCPQHCGSHADCINAIDLGSGTPIGDLIGTNLTSDGIEYVKEAVREGGDVAEFWKEQFSWIDFGAELAECDICGWPGVDDRGLCHDCARCDDECGGDDV